MLWTAARSRHPRNVALAERLAEARRDSPESGTWLALLETALDEGEPGGPWDALVPEPLGERPLKAPLLFRVAITVDARMAGRWVRRLFTDAPQAGGLRVDALTMLASGLCQDEAVTEADPVRVVAQMAVLPLLRACGRRLAARLPPTWWEGYCPLCGAWPVVAEYLGLDRKRQLRCGRCATAWAMPALRCVFCAEMDHERLGYLVSETGDPARRVEVCKTCKGYVKVLATVRATPPWALPLDDLASVHLDVAALERGYARPARPGHPLDARITARRRSGLAASLGFGRTAL